MLVEEKGEQGMKVGMMDNLKAKGFKPFCKKPITIWAKQIDKPFTVKTMEGTLEGKAGDYLVVGVKGEQYPCDKTIFEETYVEAPDIDEMIDDIKELLVELSKRQIQTKELLMFDKGGTCCPSCGKRQAHIHIGWLELGRILVTRVDCSSCDHSSLIIRWSEVE